MGSCPTSLPCPTSSSFVSFRQASGDTRRTNSCRHRLEKVDGLPAGTGGASSGVTVRTGGARVSFHLVGVTHGNSLGGSAKSEPVAAGKRVSYRRYGVTEWYVNGPLGLEQGFTLAKRPGGSGDWLTVTESLTGPLQARSSVQAIEFAGGRGR